MSKIKHLLYVQWDLAQDPQAGNKEYQKIRKDLDLWERTHQHGLPQCKIGGAYMAELEFDEDDTWTTAFLVSWRGKPWTRLVREEA